MSTTLVACGGGTDDPCPSGSCDDAGDTISRLVGDYSTTASWSSTDGSSGTYQSSGTRITASTSFPDRIQIALSGLPSFPGMTPYGCSNTAGNTANPFAVYATVDQTSLTLPVQMADFYISITGTGAIDATASMVAITMMFQGTGAPLAGCTTSYTISLAKL
ncbi:MAG TPA: hypothetical protein VM261_17570 [Kofleriaceae bacterium]|nr:hypothetical protein [Kofleriaceae bacterium]